MRFIRAAERSLSTILLSDIVGSTDHAAKLGDRRWQDLLGRHHGPSLRKTSPRLNQSVNSALAGRVDGTILTLGESPYVQASQAVTRVSPS